MPRAFGWILGIGSAVMGMLGGLLELYGTALLDHPMYPLTPICFALLALGGAGIAIAAFIPRLGSIVLCLTAIGFTLLNTSFLLWPVEFFLVPPSAIDQRHVRVLYAICLLTTTVPWGTAAGIIWSLWRRNGQQPRPHD